MDIYFDTRNLTEAQERYPLPRHNLRIAEPQPSFNVYFISNYNRHGFSWKATLNTVIRMPDELHQGPNYTADCYFRAARISWLRAWEYNNGPGGRLNDGSIGTFVRLGLTTSNELVRLHKVPSGEIVPVQGFVIGSGYYAVEKIVRT